MSVLCHLLGHKPMRSRVQLNPLTFTAHSRCRRCKAPLVRLDEHGWTTVESDPPVIDACNQPEGAAADPA